MTYTVPTNGNPTPPSRKAWVGALIGTVLFFPIGTAVGGLIGYMVGKSQAQGELDSNQKTVNAPSFWNSKLAKGLLIGAVIGALLFVGIAGVGLAGAMSVIESGAILTSVGPMFLTAAAEVQATTMVASTLGAGIAAFGASSIAGGIIGGVSGKSQMKEEYQQARQYHEHMSYGRGSGGRSSAPNRGHGMENYLAMEREQSGRPGFVEELAAARGGSRGHKPAGRPPF